MSRANPYFDAPFTVAASSFTFGQSPTWSRDGRILSNEADGTGKSQIYVSRADGTGFSCLTCGQPGANAFPQERPQGDWILFASGRGQSVTFGSPGFGGIGSDLYLMRPDGTHVTRLTAPGMSFEPSGDPFDNYHPYWSPDGGHVVWTHIDFTPAAGGTQWTMLLGTLAVSRDGQPRLSDVRVVGPGGDNAYETQAWAPDGSGFLYTTFSSDGDRSVGWLNAELHFMRLYGRGYSPEHPQSVRLTDGSPAWDEQAVFTPDMRDVVWMSSRAQPSWYQTVVTAAQQSGFDPPGENAVAGPMFVLTILDPKFRTDLYELDLSSHAIRRLTYLDSVVPEFTFDSGGTRLLWTTGDHTRTYVGTFALRHPPAKVGKPPREAPGWAGAAGEDHAPPPPVRPQSPSGMSLDVEGLPPQVVASYGTLESQLGDLTRLLQGLPQGGRCCQAPPP